jgi:GT2 family glycosyltransferase
VPGTISVIIVNWNTGVLLRDCLAGLPAAADGRPLQVIVVDNASEDGSQHAPPPPEVEYTLIQNTENHGFARANNQGLARANGEIILLLNPDTLLFPESLARMARRLENHLETGAVCPRTWLDRERTLEICSLKIPSPFRCLFTHTPLGATALGRPVMRRIWDLDARLFLTPHGAVPVEGIGGACFMLRREVFERIGLLDEGFFMGYEDTDWSFKVARLGLRIEILTDAEIVHLFGQSKRKQSPRNADWYRWDRGLLRFLRLYYPPRRVALFERTMRLLERLAERRRPPSASTSPASCEPPAPVRLSFSTPSEPTDVLEIANSPAFFDKFGRRRAEDELLLPVSLLARWAPGRYHWRLISRPAPGRIRVKERGSFPVGCA